MHRRHNEGLFERGSNVVDYWLAHCEGFDLGRSASGRRVTGVVCDRHTGHARTLLVRSRARRTHTLPAQAISAVDPFNKVLYLEPRRIAVIRKTLPRTSLRYAAAVMLVARRRLATLPAFVQPHARSVLLGATALGGAAFRGGRRRCADGVVWLRPRLRVAACETAVLARRGARAAASNAIAFVAWVRRRAPVAARRLRFLLERATAIAARDLARLRHARAGEGHGDVEELGAVDELEAVHREGAGVGVDARAADAP